MTQFDCALKNKFHRIRRPEIRLDCNFERHKDSAVSKNVSFAITIARIQSPYANAFSFNTLTSKDTKDACIEGVTQMSTRECTSPNYKTSSSRRLHGRWSTLDHRQALTTFLLSLFRRACDDNYKNRNQRISLFDRTRGWCGWDSLFEAETIGRDSR